MLPHLQIDTTETALYQTTAINIFLDYSPKMEGLLEHTFTINNSKSKKRKILILINVSTKRDGLSVILFLSTLMTFLISLGWFH